MARRRQAELLGEARSAASLLVLFIPSVDRLGHEIEQAPWVENALQFLGSEFGGATAFPKARGVWRDDAREGQLVFDEPVIVQCYVDESILWKSARKLREFLEAMGQATNQGAIGFVIDGVFYEIPFPLGQGAT